MASKTKINPIGNSKKDRLKGGETWTVQVVIDGADIGLKKDDRIRIEEKPGPGDASLFPDTDTDLYDAGYTEIVLTKIKDHPVTGFWYRFQGLLNGKDTTLWLTEGGEDGAEAEITNADPTKPGGDGGLAGIRR